MGCAGPLGDKTVQIFGFQMVFLPSGPKVPIFKAVVLVLKPKIIWCMNLNHESRGSAYKLEEEGKLWCDRTAVMRVMRDGEERGLDVEKLPTTPV